jgi:hypothetical protein
MVEEERSYERHFRALHDGDATFDEFARATAPLWRRLAAQLHRRWRMPTWHTQEETVQNFMLAAWQFVWQWEPEKTRSCQRYVIWNAYDKAKKAAHVARSAKRSGNPDRAPSHIERPMSAYGDEGGDDGEQAYASERLMHAAGSEAGVMGTRGFTAPDQEQRLIDDEERRAYGVRAWAQADTQAQLVAMQVLADAPSLGEAARRLYADEVVRVEFELEDEASALRLVEKATKAVAARMTDAA